MNDFGGLLASDFGFKPQGKSAPIAASIGSANLTSRTSRTSNPLGASSVDDYDSIFGSSANNRKSHDVGTLDGFADVFGGPPKFTSTSQSRGGKGDSGFNFDSMFGGSSDSGPNKSSSLPKFDKPMYDDDIFDSVPGLKSSSTVKYEDVFASSVSPHNGNDAFDDLFGSFSGTGSKSRGKGSDRVEKGVHNFDNLLPGFGGSSPRINRQTSEASRPSKSTVDATRTASNIMEDPFVVIGSASPPEVSSPGPFTDPLEEIGKFSISGSTKFDVSSDKGRLVDDIDPLGDLGKSVPTFSSEVSGRGKDKISLRKGSSTTGRQTLDSRESAHITSVRSPDRQSERKRHVSNYPESSETMFDTPTVSNSFHDSVGQTGSPPSYVDPGHNVMNSEGDMSPTSEDNLESSDDVWLTVSEIPLFTQPTSAPPPSRPPPPRPANVSKAEMGSFATRSARKKVDEFSYVPNSPQYYESSKSVPDARGSDVSSANQLEDFSMGRTRTNINERADVFPGQGVETNSDAAASAAAMKEAMDRAEAKFRHAKEVRGRENAKAARSREAVQLEKEEKATEDAQERAPQHREREEELREERIFEEERERTREVEREREDKEREQRKLEKERERAREIEREREKARQAVERATREARERAATEARLKAEKVAVGKVNAEARQRAERAAVQRAQAEARERAAAEAKERAEKAAVQRAQAEARERAAAEAKERAEKAAVQRAQAEARERAAAEAKERAEKAAAEARERANAEGKERAARAELDARSRAERAAVERAAAEARQRAAAEARERAAATAAAKMNQQKNEDDLESFFGMGARPSSAPKARASSSDPLFDTQFQTRQGPEVASRTSVGTSSSLRKASSTTNIAEDLSSIFGAVPSSGGFKEMEGESEERRSARLERHQRTNERAANALAEKNQRDLQVQREQAERHRISETLDAEIKRWAAGKEGNLRALLSTLQYVLWPECGWQPVSLTDLIVAASVKKAYRKATLCIHPDKVQQKGANLHQKYVAEKVFDLLKEAWNKFNSEELF